LAIGISVSLLAIGEGQSALAINKGENILALVEGCVEDGLIKIRAKANTSGVFTFTRPEGACEVTISRVGNNYTILSTNTDSSYKRKVQAEVTRGSMLTLTSWKEL
jgi:hypothetical protein